MHLKRGKNRTTEEEVNAKKQESLANITVINRSDHSVSKPMNTISKQHSAENYMNHN